MGKSLYNLQSAFRSNPGLDTLYVTADGMPFKTEPDANRHAAKLVQDATPAKMPAAGSVQETSLKAVLLASGVVTAVSRKSMGDIHPANGVAKAAVPGDGAANASPAPLTAPVVLTYDQATAANEAAQVKLANANKGLETANTNLSNARAALAALPSLPVPPAKAAPAQVASRRNAQQLVNSCVAAVADATTVQETAAYDAHIAATNLENTPA
jgi:hypothetical protein